MGVDADDSFVGSAPTASPAPPPSLHYRPAVDPTVRRERGDRMVGIICGGVAGLAINVIAALFTIMLADGRVSQSMGPFGVVWFVMGVAGLGMLCSRSLRTFGVGWLLAVLLGAIGVSLLYAVARWL